MPKKFTPEFRERAVRMVFDRQAAEGGPRAVSIRVVAESLGCGPETLRAWCNQAIAAGKATPAPATDESLGEENRRLRRELAEARRANEILKNASAFLRRNSTAPRRDDPVHRHEPRGFRGRGHLPRDARNRMWVHHLPGLPGCEDSTGLSSCSA